jgi:GNAT superfamily N-acetyltransferase
MMTSSSGLRLGASFEQAVRLEDDRRVRLRWIRRTDADLLRQGFARLSLDSRVLRFFAPLHTLGDDTIRYFTEIDGYNHAAIIAVFPSGNGPAAREEGYGVARFVRSASNPRCAELAVTVIDDAQGRGLGRRLVATLAAAALERDVDTFEMSVLGRNWRVREFLRRRHAEFRRRDGEVLEYTLGTAAIVASSRRSPRVADHTRSDPLMAGT